MKEQRCLWLGIVIACLLLSSCNVYASDLHASAIQAKETQAQVTSSKALFSFSGNTSGIYQLQATTPISKLRHGHAEFTIDIVDGKRSLVIVFFGYTGPATYQLTNRTNGGDVRITLDQQYWDLSLIPTLTCTLVVHSDEPTEETGIDHMRGKFSCPTLPAGHFNTSNQPVTVTSGQFDIAIIVES